MSVRVSVAGAAEWRTVKEIRLRALGHDPAAFGSTLAREQAYDDDLWHERTAAGRTFLARRDGAVVGLASFYVEPGREHERQLVGMWVAPEARRTGVAPALVRAVCAAAAAEGAARLTLFVAEGNEPARRLYERLGFRRTGEVQRLPSNPCLGEERYVLALA
jgi:ribosomal protein S18 acetylase RimI-like enzyme